MIRKSLAATCTAATLTAAALLPGAPAATAAAASQMQFGMIQYDPPGNDTGTNARLNTEWANVKNTGTTTVNLKGWSIRDAQNHLYIFRSDTRVAPGGYVRVHTGTGSAVPGHRYWVQSWYVWNNTGDTARLIRNDGVLRDTCTWSGSGAYTTC
jgi:hypothetical protein